MSASPGFVLLLGGPAGAGKSTLARAWCATRPQAAHVQLDEVRSLIVSGLADPQVPGERQESQYDTSVEATCALARAFVKRGIDVAVDDVLEPRAFERYWRHRLEGLSWSVVIVLPTLDTALARSAGREKRVRDQHTRAQHASCQGWPDELKVDTTGLSVEESLAMVVQAVASAREGATGM